MGKVIDTDPTPPTAPPAPRSTEEHATAHGAVVVYLSPAEREILARHAEDLTVPVPALIRRAALTAVHAVNHPLVNPHRLTEGAGIALGKDFPETFGGPERGHRRERVAGSFMRWLLSRFAVMPLPAPVEFRDHTRDDGTGHRVPVWRIRLRDGSDLEVRTHHDRVCVGGGLAFTPDEWMALAAAGTAAANTITGMGVDTEQQPELERSTP